MFTRPTVVILGAGASCHYGYPSGEELVALVQSRAETMWLRYQAYLDTKGRPPPLPNCLGSFDAPSNIYEFTSFMSSLHELHTKLHQANPLVIDNFLWHNPQLAEIGKLLIAIELIHRERIHPTRPPDTKDKDGKAKKDDWIRFITHQLTIGCRVPAELLANKLQFVTFNYDLSLELRLREALNGMEWFAEDNLIEDFIGKERIFHVYGQLRRINESGNSLHSKKVVSYADTEAAWFDCAPSNEDQAMARMAKGIDLAFEASRNLHTIAPIEKTTAPDIDKAQAAIAGAHYLYIFGFGFDRENCRIIGLGQPRSFSETQYVYFTNLDNQNRVNKQFASIFGLHAATIVGNNFQAHDPRGDYSCEKSTRKVYDALAYDIDLIG